MTDSSGMGSRIRSGLAWKALSQILLQLSRFVVALVLARMLAPHDWGLAAMVMVFAAFAVVFTDNALGTALVQRRNATEEDRSTVFWISAAVGLAVTGIAIAAAEPIARFYGEPEVRGLLVVLSLTFIVSALGTTHNAILVRDMHFRRLELCQIAATAVGAVAGIATALQGGGAWAIVIQQLANSVALTALLWALVPWRPRLLVSRRTLSEIGGFTGNVFAQNVLFQAGRNLEKLLMGRFLGAAALGTYALAYNVMLVPFSRIAAPLQQVFFPAFARMQDDRPGIAALWIRVARMVAAISFPALAGLVTVAPDFVTVVLGEKWEAATPVIQILAWVGVLQSVQTLNGEILLALGKANWLFRFTILWFAAGLIAFIVGVQWGVIGVAVCVTIAIAIVEPLNAYITARALGLPFLQFIRAFVGVTQATALMCLATLATREALVAAGVSAAPRLLLVILVGAAVYVPCCLWRAPEVGAELAALGRRQRRARSAAPQLSES